VDAVAERRDLVVGQLRERLQSLDILFRFDVRVEPLLEGESQKIQKKAYVLI
jgi:hypothetical protein